LKITPLSNLAKKMKKTIFTVGHSTHTIDYFLELINAHAVNCVVEGFN